MKYSVYSIKNQVLRAKGRGLMNLFLKIEIMKFELAQRVIF